jgi:hypothetical protein
MKDHTDCKRGFTHTSAAWYGKAVLANCPEMDRVTMGFYHPEGGTTGEFAIEWLTVGGKVTPQLQAFNDGWSALHLFADVLAKLAERDSEDPTPNDVCAILLACGVEDMTPHRYEDSYPER